MTLSFLFALCSKPLKFGYGKERSEFQKGLKLWRSFIMNIDIEMHEVKQLSLFDWCLSHKYEMRCLSKSVSVTCEIPSPPLQISSLSDF